MRYNQRFRISRDENIDLSLNVKKLGILLLLVITTAFIGEKSVPLTKIDSLLQRIENGKDTTFVVNFWATWCGPCVEELHYFTEMDSLYKKSKLKVILVSMDFKKEISTKLIPFIKKRNINTEVLFLDETNDNEWMPKVNIEWQGNIPATLIKNSALHYQIFLPRQTSGLELDSLINTIPK